MSHELYRSHESAHDFDSMVVQDITQRDVSHTTPQTHTYESHTKYESRTVYESRTM